MTTEASPGSRGPILIIDADRGVREYLRRRLEDRGYEVETVHDARGAFDKLRAGLAPCLVLFDLRLLYEGLKLERRFDVSQRSLGDTPVVAYTADAALRKSLRAGSGPRKPATSLDRLCELAARHCPLPAPSGAKHDRSLVATRRRSGPPSGRREAPGEMHKRERRDVSVRHRKSCPSPRLRAGQELRR
jgi:CheY-like chemotaxis protein